MCYPVYGMMNIKEPLLLIGKSSSRAGSGFTLSLSDGPIFLKRQVLFVDGRNHLGRQWLKNGSVVIASGWCMIDTRSIPINEQFFIIYQRQNNEFEKKEGRNCFI